MPTERYPKFIGLNLEEITYQQLKVAGKENERNVAQQARYWIKQGLIQWKLERMFEWMANRVR